MVQINAERFLADLHELRKIGAYKTGVHRPTFSPQDMESRHWLMERLRECGLEASIDGIGNVGRLIRSHQQLGQRHSEHLLPWKILLGGKMTNP